MSLIKTTLFVSLSLLLAGVVWVGVTPGTAVLIGCVLLAGGWVRPVWCVAAAVALLIARVSPTPAPPSEPGALGTAGAPSISRFNSLVPERDAVLLGAALLPLIGGITAHESDHLLSDLQQHYQALESEQGRYASPLLLSLFGARSPEETETISFCGGRCRSAPTGDVLLFLHGSGGNFTLLCWLISRSVASLGMETVCPSHTFSGGWGSAVGSRRLETVLRRLEQAGAKRIFLAGLSAGAVGASRLVPELASRVKGVILLFGGDYPIALTTLPTLLIFGRDDERFSAGFLRSVGAARSRSGSGFSSVELPGTHFHLLRDPTSIQRVIESWLREQLSHKDDSHAE